MLNKRYPRIQKKAVWLGVWALASLPPLNGLFWAFVNFVSQRPELRDGPIGQALPVMFKADTEMVVVGLFVLTSYLVANVMLALRLRTFLIPYVMASIARTALWGSQIFNYDFPMSIGYVMLAVDGIVILFGSRWYANRNKLRGSACAAPTIRPGPSTS